MAPSATSNSGLGASRTPLSPSNSSLFEDTGAPSPSRLGSMFDDEPQESSPFIPSSRPAKPAPAAADTVTPQRSPITSPPPPYWSPTSEQEPTRSGRAPHNLKRRNTPGTITLQDNESRSENGDDAPADGGAGRDRNRACWARGVVIPDWTVVGGGLGRFVCYNVKVETLRGPSMNIRKRYSEFDRLRTQLVETFPHNEGAIPKLPHKTIFPEFSDDFLEKRRSKLEYFLSCVLLNPEFAGAPVVKDFLFDLSGN